MAARGGRLARRLRLLLPVLLLRLGLPVGVEAQCCGQWDEQGCGWRSVGWQVSSLRGRSGRINKGHMPSARPLEYLAAAHHPAARLPAPGSPCSSLPRIHCSKARGRQGCRQFVQEMASGLRPPAPTVWQLLPVPVLSQHSRHPTASSCAHLVVAAGSGALEHFFKHLAQLGLRHGPWRWRRAAESRQCLKPWGGPFQTLPLPTTCTMSITVCQLPT